MNTNTSVYYTVWTAATYKAHGRDGDTTFESKEGALEYAQALRDQGERCIHVSFALSPKQHIALSRHEWDPFVEPTEAILTGDDAAYLVEHCQTPDCDNPADEGPGELCAECRINVDEIPTFTDSHVIVNGQCTAWKTFWRALDRAHQPEIPERYTLPAMINQMARIGRPDLATLLAAWHRA